jgi:hypothetical protein
MSKKVYDIDPAGDVLCTYTDVTGEALRGVRYISCTLLQFGD